MNLDADTLRKFRYQFARKIGEVDPYHKVLGFDDLPGEFAATEFTVLFSGPPTVTMAKQNQDALTPIGLVQNISYNGQRNVTPIPEMGNKSYRYIPGRVIHSAQIGRILSRQGSLLHACYAWMERFIGNQNVGIAVPPGDDGIQTVDGVAGPNAVGRHWTTLESDLFNIPTGFLLVVGNANGEVLSKVYWEKCILPDYMFQLDASQTSIIEQVSIRMSRAVPMAGMKIGLQGDRSFGAFTGSAGSSD